MATIFPVEESQSENPLDVQGLCGTHRRLHVQGVVTQKSSFSYEGMKQHESTLTYSKLLLQYQFRIKTFRATVEIF